MANPASREVASKRFAARARNDTRCAAKSIEGAQSAAEAAILFAEHWECAVDKAGLADVVVTDCQTGEQHSFRVDVGAPPALRKERALKRP